MATSLDSYLRGPYKEDRAFLDTLQTTIEEVIPLFYTQNRKLLVGQEAEGLSVSTWPYAVSLSEGELKTRAQSFSASTHCMILFALEAMELRRKDRFSTLLGKKFRPHQFSNKLSSRDKERLQKVIAAAEKDLVEVVNRSGTPLVKSGTYGEDDPFTLTWLTEIASRGSNFVGVTAENLAACKEKVIKAVNEALDRKNILNTENTGFREVTGAFLKVKRLHLAHAAQRINGQPESTAKKWMDDNTPKLWKDFDDTIHRQLSYSSMGDQKFDPAELAFAFEGALLLHPNWIGRSTEDQVIDALRLSKDRHPFWRPITPFLANDRGHVLFLISIEVANSILRACEILDEDEGVPSRFSQFEPQLRVYAMWLLGEMEEIRNPTPTEPNLVGWRTEYEDTRDTIQLWHTSHVLVFLAHYASLLKRKIAAEAIDAAGLHVEIPDENKNYWDDEPLRSCPGYAVLTKIRNQYLNPLDKSEGDYDGPRSMLLYGPPGTGKTTVAEQLAAGLNRPLIVVTVSDFLAAGAAEIENRAKGVFEVLSTQEDVVILFDEIDQFLLDRNSEFYREQDDIFKFMTPGMLTKLQDLRDTKNCVFIIATNYYERIDGAIKRRGRIDEHFLLSLPDLQQRLNLLKRFVVKSFPRAENNGIGEQIAKVEAALQKTDVGEKTAALGYGDLKNLVESTRIAKPMLDIESFAAALAEAAKQVESAVSLSEYRSRFDTKGPFPFEEFFLVLYLFAESGKELSDRDTQSINHVLNQIPNIDEKNFEYRLKKRGIKDEPIRGMLRKYLAEVFADRKNTAESQIQGSSK